MKIQKIQFKKQLQVISLMDTIYHSIHHKFMDMHYHLTHHYVVHQMNHY